MDDDLNAQIAQRLFGFEWDEGLSCWLAPEPMVYAETTPAYTTDHNATAEVWRWLETRGRPLGYVTFAYIEVYVECTIDVLDCHRCVGLGATWQEALCRAALALAWGRSARKHPCIHTPLYV